MNKRSLIKFKAKIQFIKQIMADQMYANKTKHVHSTNFCSSMSMIFG